MHRVKMLRIILVFYISIAGTWASRETQISTSIVDGYYGNLNIDPYINIGNKLYYFGQSKVTWYKASLICRSIGGFLAATDSAEELTELSNYMAVKYPTDRWWWLSGSDLDSEGDFFWYRTGERFSYADWSAGQPDNAGGNENCVHLWYQKTKYQMNDWICNRLAYYICEADMAKSVFVSLF